MPEHDEDQYRQTARTEIEAWKRKRPSRVIATLSKPAQFLGYPIRKAVETERGRQLLERVIGAFFDAGTWRFSPEAVLNAYTERGYSVARIADIKDQVPLRAMDDEAKKHWIAGTAVLTVEGGIVGPAMAVAATAAGSAAAASGGAAGPAAAAAGLAVVASAAAAETVFLITFCCRRLASIAACYGYDVADDRERAFALQILNVATAENLEAKETALADLGNLAGRLGLKKQPWSQLEDRSMIARVLRELAHGVGWQITQAQLRRILTIVGALLGAGFNGHLGYTTTRAGYFVYRERMLDEAPAGSHRQPDRQHGSASAIPAAVEGSVAEWRRRGMPRQSPTTCRREAWAETFPEHRELIMSLPLELDRPAVREVIAKLDAGPSWAVRSFVVTQIWGYRNRGYGPSRVRRILDDAGDSADGALAEAATLANQDGPVAAFRALAGELKLRGLGTAFATKFLFFVDRNERTLILDDFIADWLRENADLRLTLQPMRSRDYERYLDLMHCWAEALGLAPTELEEVLFTAGAGDRPRSPWAN